MSNWLSHLRERLQTAKVPVTATMNGAEAPADALTLRLKRPPVLLYCPRENPQADMLLRLAAALAEEIGQSAPADSPETRWQRILRGESSPAADDIQGNCRVLALSLHTEEEALPILRDLTPTQPGDRLVAMEGGQVALIKRMSANGDLDEAAQYAEALAETVSGETGMSLRIGVSEVCKTPDRLPEAWQEAQTALHLGLRYHPGREVSCFERLVLERLLAEQPPERAHAYRNLVFNRKTARLLNAEMLETIELFFQKDLNLSDTARQLFIHRNTLVYRLDKLQKQTGLDLRRFDDAVAFRVLMLLGEDSATQVDDL